MQQTQVKIGGDSVLRIKGLESPCVIWSTRIPVMSVEEVEEFVYTILTRTAGLLIITISPGTLEAYKPVLNTFDRERLIFWDKESFVKFDTNCAEKDLSDEYEAYLGENPFVTEEVLL